MKWSTKFSLANAAALVLLAGCQKNNLAPSNASSSEVADASAAPEESFDPSAPRAAQPRLKTMKLWLGAQELVAELAIAPDEIRTGMMFRTNLVPNEGMFFVLPFPERASFWMKNCPAPLSCAYIDAQGVILELHDMEPFNTNAIVAGSENISYVLETPRGWFQTNNIRAGMSIRTERGTLRETFRQSR